MNNRQYGAGERNHYFYGKLMTVRDFEDEQTYLNNKRRLGNRLLHGVGVVAGLGVLLVDNQTISLEAGMALDYQGREIVVPEPCVKRLSAISGFDEITESGTVYLGISYQEELCEGTFAVSGGGDGSVGKEYNRIHEGYELFLTTQEPNRGLLGLEGMLYETVHLFQSEGIRLSLQIPRYVNTDEQFTAKVLFQKRDVSAPVHFSFTLESDLFRDPQGEKRICVEYHETEVTTYKELELPYTMCCGPVKEDYTQLRIAAQSFQVRVGNHTLDGLEEDVVKPVAVIVRPLREVVAEGYYAAHFDERLWEQPGQAIYLAKIHVIAGQNAFLMEHLIPDPFHQRLPNVQLLDLLQGLTSISQGAKEGTAPIQRARMGKEEGGPPLLPQTAGGVEQIMLGVSPKVGRSYFSHEFIHGLGVGHVCVTVALENSEAVGGGDTLMFGEGVFPAGEFSLSDPACSVGAMVNTQKGTLQLGVKLLEKTTQQSLRVRWWAWRPDAQGDKRELPVEDIRLSITPDTAHVEPLQQVRFQVSVQGGASQEVIWSVVEKHGGSIDRNGLYTAPATEGVFEVCAQSVKYPGHKTSAYVVVSKM